MQRWSIEAFTAACAAALYLATVPACGGKAVPEHDGYRSKWKQGWKKPKKLELDEDFEVEFDGELSYPKRRRVRWFEVETPEDGELDITLQASPLGLKGDSDEVDAEDPFDVAFELYDHNYKMLLRADREEDDAGDRKKTRTAYELAQGTYLVHVFLQRRLDEAEYTLRLKFNRGQVEPQTGFPKDVAFVEPLPVVPAIDDAPPPPPPRKHRRCRGRKCKKKKDRHKKPEPQAEDGTPTADRLQAKIIVIRTQSGGGTSITLNRGANHGVAKGWKGKVVSKSGKTVTGGGFVVVTVKDTSCKARVNLTSDAVKQAGRAVLTAP